MAPATLDYVPALIAWLAVAYELPWLHRAGRDRGARLFWLTLLLLALGLTVLLAPVYRALDRVTDIPNVGRLVSNSLVVLASWNAQRFVFHLTGAKRSPLRAAAQDVALPAATLATLAVLFVLAPVDETETTDFTGRYGAAAYMLEYRILFLAFLGLTMYNVARESWRYSGVVTRPSLHLGLRTVSVGAAFGLVYAANEALYASARRLELSYFLPDPLAVTHVLMLLAVVLILSGSTVPKWGPRLGVDSLYIRLRHYRTCRRLYRLWSELCRVWPGLALVPPRSRLADAVSPWDIDFRLHRRVVEILDGILLLGPYLDASVAERTGSVCRQRGLSTRETELIVEAAVLAAAIEARRSCSPAADTIDILQRLNGTSLDEQAEHLEQLARHWPRLPAVYSAGRVV